MIGKLIGGIVILLASAVHAATLTVTSIADNGAGSLRDALASAANGDTIVFSLTLPATITLTNEVLVVSNSVTIFGPGPANLAVSGNNASRVFYVSSNLVVTIAGLTIRDGAGGGIHNDHSTLTVSNCTLSANSGFFGGGIYNDGSLPFRRATLMVANSTFISNSAHSGGGIFNDGRFIANATLTVVSSTFISNSAARVGGGIYNAGYNGNATLTVINSTLSGNSAGDDTGGGGIYNSVEGPSSAGYAYTLVYGCTLSGNSAHNIVILNGALRIGNTILNAPSPSGNLLWFVQVISDGYNLISGSGGAWTNATDQINTDPLLGPLADNGGPTLTHGLLPGSPAIDKGKNLSGSITDQRGLPRIVNDPCLANAAGGDGTDIGAFETQDVCADFNITAITPEANDIRVVWTTYTGKTNALERMTGAAGSFSNNFASITNILTTSTTTNVLDLGAATNGAAIYYRVRLVP